MNRICVQKYRGEGNATQGTSGTRYEQAVNTHPRGPRLICASTPTSSVGSNPSMLICICSDVGDEFLCRQGEKPFSTSSYHNRDMFV